MKLADIFTSHTIISLFAIACLTFLGYSKGMDVSQSLTFVALGVSSAAALSGSKWSQAAHIGAANKATPAKDQVDSSDAQG